MIRMSKSFWVIVIVVITAFLVVLGHSRWATVPLEDRTFIPEKEVITPEIELLRAYVRIDTSNPPGNVADGARFLVDELARRGVTAELIESAPGRANVYARIRGRSPGGGLLLLSHIDVYPAPAKAWTEPPFAGRTRMNMLYGRGTLDMKSIAISQLVAFAEIATSGKTPQRDVVFLATADEETGGELGIVWLLENRPDIFEGIEFALNEGGISETLRDEPTFFGVEVASRQIVLVRLQSSNRRDLERARTALLPLQRPRDPQRVLPEVPGILKDASHYRIRNRELLADVESVIANGDSHRLQEMYQSLFVSSVVPLGIHASELGGFELDVWLLNLPDELPENAIRRVRELVTGFGVELSVISTQGPSPISRVDTPLFEMIGEAVHAAYGAEVFVGPLILPYSSNDSRHLRARGIQAYGVCPRQRTCPSRLVRSGNWCHAPGRQSIRFGPIIGHRF